MRTVRENISTTTGIGKNPKAQNFARPPTRPPDPRPDEYYLLSGRAGLSSFYGSRKTLQFLAIGKLAFRRRLSQHQRNTHLGPAGSGLLVSRAKPYGQLWYIMSVSGHTEAYKTAYAHMNGFCSWRAALKGRVAKHLYRLVGDRTRLLAMSATRAESTGAALGTMSHFSNAGNQSRRLRPINPGNRRV